MTRKEPKIEFTDEKGNHCVGIDVKELAVFMHDEYERISKKIGWDTQDKCKVEFDDLPDENKQVMISMAFSLIDYFGKELNR